MPCIILILALVFPRLLLLLIFLTSSYLERAFDNLLFPLAGFLFLPLTTLVYAWTMNSHGSIDGLYVLALILAVISDLGLMGSSGRRARRR